MNITLLVNRDIASCLAVNTLLAGLGDHRVTVFLSSRVGSKPLAPALQHLKFVEQDLFNQLLFPLLPGPAGQAGELLGFDQLRDVLGGRLTELNTINQSDGLARFADSEPDLVLSVRYGHILKDPVLRIPTHGVLNLHSGRLPDYKGVMATFWALSRGEREIGTTLHFIDDSSIDTGRIIATTSLMVEPQRSYLWHVLALYRDGCQAMLSAVAALAAGETLNARPQGPGGGYFTFPSAGDLAAFAAAGWRLYDPDDVSSLARRFLGISPAAETLADAG